MSLANKSALVTGATGGIGRAICEEFLKNGITNLAVLDLNAQEGEIVEEWIKNFSGSSITYFKVDVSSDEELAKCYKIFTKKIPNLDIVVNCAKIFNENTYRDMINVNLCGVIGSTLLAVEHMRADKRNGKGGAIINIASVYGVFPHSFIPTYSATKHGIVTFTRCLAHGRESMCIKFLTLCPGATETPFIKKSKSSEDYFEMNEDIYRKMQISFKNQTPDKVSGALLDVLEKGKNGSVWIIENGELTEYFGTGIAT